MPMNMWSTPATKPWYNLARKWLRKEIWTLHTWSSVAQQCILQVWGRYVSTPSKFFSCQFIILVWKWCCFLLLASKKKKKKRKKINERSCHGDNIESSSTRHHGKYSQCPAFDIKQNPARRSPEDYQVRAQAYLYLKKAQSCFMLPLFVFSVCSGLSVWCTMHS